MEIFRRNQVRQVIKLKDGGERIVWHEKPSNAVEKGDHKAWWLMMNKAPKYNSKRQTKLREEQGAQGSDTTKDE